MASAPRPEILQVHVVGVVPLGLANRSVGFYTRVSIPLDRPLSVTEGLALTILIADIPNFHPSQRQNSRLVTQCPKACTSSLLTTALPIFITRNKRAPCHQHFHGQTSQP